MDRTTDSDIFERLWSTAFSNRGTLTVSSKGVNVHGIEQGDIFLVGLNWCAALGVIGTLHVAGRHYWSGRGDQGYAGARIETVLLLPRDGETGDSRTFRYVKLTDIEVPRNPADRRQTNADILASIITKETS